MKTVYISIGNSDDKLSQAKWSHFIQDVRYWVEHSDVETHGVWFSLPEVQYQNMCVCVEGSEEGVEYLKYQLTHLRERYGQDSIAWALARVEFI